MTLQLELLDKSEMDLLRERVEKVQKSSDNVRRGIYARHAELAKMYMEVKHELDTLKEAICRASCQG